MNEILDKILPYEARAEYFWDLLTCSKVLTLWNSEKIFICLNPLTKPLSSSSIKSKGLEYKEIQMQQVGSLPMHQRKEKKT